jgi:hypothetical protein
MKFPLQYNPKSFLTCVLLCQKFSVEFLHFWSIKNFTCPSFFISSAYCLSLNRLSILSRINIIIKKYIWFCKSIRLSLSKAFLSSMCEFLNWLIWISFCSKYIWILIWLSCCTWLKWISIKLSISYSFLLWL